MANLEDILNFWFNEITPAQWWQKSDDFDNQIKQRFQTTHASAIAGELYSWRQSAEGRLAEIIVIDQFSRNIFRDTPQAFAYDGIALTLAQTAVELGADQALPIKQRAFMYLPYMHSESKFIHEVAVKLFSQPGLENNLDFEMKHKRIIDRFDRYPHRNTILGRASSTEEQAFLLEDGSSF